MDIYGLLDIKEDVLQNFPLLANRVADHQIEKVINRNTSKLKLIEENVLVEKQLNVSVQTVDEVIQKVIKSARKKDGSSDSWSFHELRIISYYLTKLRGNPRYYQFALNLLDEHWRSIFFNGLVFYLMNSWHSIEKEYREMTCHLLTQKLANYNDKNRRYLLLKEHIDFFEPSGPIRLAALVQQKEINIIEAPTLLGYKNATLCASYYSDVIIKFFQNRKVENYPDLNVIFQLHNNNRTKKLVFANLVEYENENPNGFRRDKLCQYINHTLGDVSLASTWAPFIGATQKEADRLHNAMKMVNIWFAQQIIETFFEICVQDSSRKNFWLDYVENIDGFKIVGSSVIRALLRSNQKIGNTFSKLFIETNSTTSQTAALVFFMKNKVLVEFSDTGALYVYNKNHPKARKILRSPRSLNSTADLKETSMDKLIDNYEWGQTNNEEGRMSHIGYWQQRLANWLQVMVIDSRQPSFNDYNKQEEDLFQARPLPSEPDLTADTSDKNKVDELHEESASYHPEPINKNSQTEVGTNEKLNDSGNKSHEKFSGNMPTPPVSEHLYSRGSIISGKTTNNEKTSEPEYNFQKGFRKIRERIKQKFQSDKTTPPTFPVEDTSNDNDYNNSPQILFVNRVKYILSSKSIHGSYQVIANQVGFYLYNFFTSRSALLQKNTPHIKEGSSIWLKTRGLSGWFEICLNYADSNDIIGYLFFNEDNSISFKKHLHENEIKRIQNF